MRLPTLVLVAGILLSAGCTKVYLPQPSDSTPIVQPTPLPPIHTVEYRVLGTAHRATIGYGNAQEGTTELEGTIPWTASFTTTRTSLFVYIAAESLSDGVVRVQIFVDGQLFREAANGPLAGSFAQASGTAQFDPEAGD